MSPRSSSTGSASRRAWTPSAFLPRTQLAVPSGWDHLGPIDALADHLERGGIAEVVLLLEDGSGTSPSRSFASAENVAWQPRLPSPAGPRSSGGAQPGVKRIVDVVGAVTGLVIRSPILAAAAVAIAMDDGPPVLFRQPRAGLNGRPFEIVKFRTMDARRRRPRAELRDNEVAATRRSR